MWSGNCRQHKTNECLSCDKCGTVSIFTLLDFRPCSMNINIQTLFERKVTYLINLSLFVAFITGSETSNQATIKIIKQERASQVSLSKVVISFNDKCFT